MTAAIAILTGMYSKVHLVFSNEYLMERDRVEFEDLWMLTDVDTSDETGQVQYHVGCNFVCEGTSLVIIDEADIFMLGDAERFREFANGVSCVCFTATPDNGKTNGTEQKFIELFGFKRYDYMLGGVPLEQTT